MTWEEITTEIEEKLKETHPDADTILLSLLRSLHNVAQSHFQAMTQDADGKTDHAKKLRISKAVTASRAHRFAEILDKHLEEGPEEEEEGTEEESNES